jgi:hypothetical protein
MQELAEGCETITHHLYAAPVVSIATHPTWMFGWRGRGWRSGGLAPIGPEATDGAGITSVRAIETGEWGANRCMAQEGRAQ